MNSFGKRFLAVALSLAFSVAILELGLRLPEPPAGYTDTSVDNKFTDYRLPDDWEEPRDSAETVRVLVLGDSFTWGDGVHEEDAYPQRMQFRMNLHDPARRHQVFNAGRNGLNTVAEREELDELELLDSEPDLVLLGFTLNDPEPRDRILARSFREPIRRRMPAGRVELELHRRSRLFQLVHGRLENSRQRRAMNEYVASLFDTESPYWLECRQALVSFRDHLGARGIPFLVAVLPAFESPFDDRYPYVSAHEQIMGTLAELDIPAVDLLSLYAGVEVRRLAVTPFTDPHPNELAHRIAADFLAAHVGECLQVEVGDNGGRRSSWRCGEAG